MKTKKERMDYYERTMTNHILGGREHGTTGETVYFTPLAPGFHKEFEHENSCCHGTGLEGHFKYADMVYAHEGQKAVCQSVPEIQAGMEGCGDHNPTNDRDGTSRNSGAGSGEQRGVSDGCSYSGMERGRKRTMD